MAQFFAMVNFTNPGVLGTPADFRRRYESAILQSREPDATEAEAAAGAERSAELSGIVNEFILRRTNALLSAHLPPKVDILFIMILSAQNSLSLPFPKPAQHSATRTYCMIKSLHFASFVNTINCYCTHRWWRWCAAS